jgi:hypothetical protein
MSNVDTSYDILKQDAVALFIACVDIKNIIYNEIQYDERDSASEVKEAIFKYIIDKDSNVFRVFKLIGTILTTMYNANKKDYFVSKNIMDEDQLLIVFMDDVMNHKDIQSYLGVHYILMGKM